MGISEMLLLLLVYVVVTGLIFFSDFKRVRADRYRTQGVGEKGLIPLDSQLDLE